MKILLTGATGRVGRTALQALRKKHFLVHPLGFRHCDAGIESVDLLDFKATARVVDRTAPDVIVHLAGNRNVSFCEKEKEKSHRLNHGTSEYLCRLCNQIDAKMVFISSDYVFDGLSGPFAEHSSPSPQTQYGRDKLETEQFIQTHMANFAIIRTSGIFGIADDLVSVVMKELRDKNSFRAFSNLSNTPTYIADFNQMLMKVLGDDVGDILHCTGSETLSRYQFAVQIARVFEQDEKKIHSQQLDFSKDLRPPNLAMESLQTYTRLGYFPSSLQQALQQIRQSADHL